jgi:hypothetical protein
VKKAGQFIYLFALMTACFIAGCLSRPAEKTVSAPPARAAASADFGKADLVKKIREVEPSSIDELLDLLPESFRSRHVIAFKSDSLQKASYLRPRVLMFNADASFILAFNGDPDLGGYEAIETLQFNYEENRFELEEFTFAEDLKVRQAALTKKNDRKALADLLNRSDREGPNAKTCLGCHRQDPRPNWDHYPVWPGFYGQVDNMIFNKVGEVDRLFPDPVTGSVPVLNNRDAAEEFPKFVKLAPALSRYRAMRNLEGHLPGKENVLRSRDRFLSQLTGKLAKLNFKRIVRILRQHPKYDELKYLAATIGLNCESELEFQDAISYNNKSSRNPTRLPYWNEKFAGYGLPVESFFMNFKTGPGNSMSTPGTSLSEFLYALVSQDNELAALGFRTTPGSEYAASMANGVQDICPELSREFKRRSQE